MTTPSFARALLTSPRQLAAWALVGYAGLHLAFAFLLWLVPANHTTFAGRSASADFTSLVEVAMPVLAVLLATWNGAGAVASAAVPRARQIVTVAVVEYAVILFFGPITYLIGLGAVGNLDGLGVLAYLLLGLGRIGLAAVAGLVAYQAWVRLGGSLGSLRR